MSNQPIPYPLRMPDELRELLTERSKNNGRSLNAEILGILQDAIGEGRAAPAGIDVDAFADAVADRVAARLQAQGR